MAKLTLSSITADYSSKNTINANWALIEAAIENTLSRDGTTPNTMSGDIDMNGNSIKNLDDPVDAGDAVSKSYAEANYAGAGLVAAAVAAAAAAEAAQTAAEAAQANAETAQTAAEAAQTAAETAQTNAETAQTAAEVALASTQAVYDSFDDRYLGAKASDPTLDNDGNPLLTGAIYWNTTSNKMRVYSGSAWGDVANITTLSGLTDTSISGLSTGEVLQWNGAAWVNGIVPSATTFVNDASGNPVADISWFNVVGTVTEDVWETIGPTGSGADNIWAQLDGVPTDVDWIELRFWLVASSSGDTANTARSLTVWAGDGLSGARQDYQVVGMMSDTTGSTGNGHAQTVVVCKIPVTSRTLSLQWSQTFNNAWTIKLWITGWGYNA